jgi:transcriptional regulator with XRE-family HTH domain
MKPGFDDDVAMFLRLVGARIAAARRDLGMTDRDLEKRSTVPTSVVAALSRGDAGIEIDQLHRLATALRIPVGDLVPGHDEVAAERQRESDREG